MMSTDRDRRRLRRAAQRSHPEYREHQNLLRRTRYRERTALQRQLSGQHAFGNWYPRLIF